MNFLKKIKILKGNIIPNLYEKTLLFFKNNNNIKKKIKILKIISERNIIDNNIKNMHLFLKKNIKKKKYKFDISLSGTGGDKKKTVNITTSTSFFLGMMNYKISKINSRSYTSKVGSSDFLNRIFKKNIFINKKINMKIRKKTNIFFYNYNIILKNRKIIDNLYKIRKKYNKPTIFNYGFSSYVPFKTILFALGTNNIETLKYYKKTKFINSKKIIIFSSYDNTDEITTLEKFKLLFLNKKKKTYFIFDPYKFGFSYKKGFIKIIKKNDSIKLFKKIFKNKNELFLDNILLNISIILCFKTGIKILKIYSILKNIYIKNFYSKKISKILKVNDI